MPVIKMEAITLQVANIIIITIMDIVIKQMNKISLKYYVLSTVFSLLMSLGSVLKAEIPLDQPSLQANHFKDSTLGSSAEDMNAPGTVYFAPPAGWHYAQSEMLNPNIRAMVVGQAKNSVPPSMNLRF